MNKHHPSPEDSASVGKTPIEQHLKRLQPPPVGFNAQTILKALHESEQQAAPPDLNANNRGGQAARWLELSAACAGGIVIGMLLTSLVWMRSDFPAHSTGETLSQPAPRSVVAVEPAAAAIGETNTSHDDDNANQDGTVRQRGGALPRWSRAERLLLADLTELRRSGLLDERPLVAGCFVRFQSISTAPLPDSPAVDDLEPPSELLEDYAPAPRSIMTPNSKQLLDELLGFGFGRGIGSGL